MGGSGSGGKRKNAGAKKKCATMYYATELTPDMQDKWVYLGGVFAKNGHILIRDLFIKVNLTQYDQEKIIEEQNDAIVLTYKVSNEDECYEDDLAVVVSAWPEHMIYYVFGLVKNIPDVGLRIVQIKMNVVPQEALDTCEPFDGEYEEYVEPSTEAEGENQ